MSEKSESVRVLVVDGAPDARAAFTGALGARFSLEFAKTAAEALAMVAARPPAVVLVAARLPDKSGAQLLAQLRERVPEATRLMFGPVDATLILEGVNQAAISRYIVTPWRAEELSAVLDEAVALSAQARHGRLLALGLLDARSVNGLSEAAASYAHDMCSPLSALATNLERLEQHVPAVANLGSQAGRAGVALDLAQRDATQELGDITHESQQSVGALTTLVEGLRSRARPPSGGASDVGMTLANVLPWLRALVADRGGELVVEHAASAPLALAPAELAGLLVQLVGDAAAVLAPALAQRKVTLRLAPEREGLRISVADTGPGLSKEERRQVERTKVTSTARSLRPGLAPVRERAIRAGGSFQLESAVGQGTTVSVWLPCADAR